jgi:hypothetical protein
LKPAAASSVSTWHSAMFVEFLWIAGQIPMSQGLISPDYQGPPTCTLCSGRCRPSLSQTSCATDYNIYYDKSELRCSDWKEIQRCPLPLAVRLVTSWPRDGSDVSWSQRVALKRLQVWAGEDMSSDLRTLVDCPFQSNPRVL